MPDDDGRLELLTGWGRTAPSAAHLVPVRDEAGIRRVLSHVGERGGVARGLGRSYGDAAQCAGGTVLDCTGLTDGIHVGSDGSVRLPAGTSLDSLLRAIVPRGWFVPVTPGTRFVTIGGAIASDIHGKNHHVDGSIGVHLDDLTLLLPAGERVTVGPAEQPDLFWATVGGMGLTGVIVEATLRLVPIGTSSLLVDTDRAADLDAVMALMEAGDAGYRYSVAWIDLMASGPSLGRAVLTRGRFARLDDLPPSRRADGLGYGPRTMLHAPPWVPSHLLNPLTIRAFNELWFRKAPQRRRDELQPIATFFHPLDGVVGWNRLYGRQGFLQWQCVVPFGEEVTLRRLVERLSSSGCTSFFAVLKRFGPGNRAPLSFPAPGWTLSLDIPAGLADLGPLLDELDEWVVSAGGRLYLAKDSRVRPELIDRMYPRLGEWRVVRERVDPSHALQSDLSRRLGL